MTGIDHDGVMRRPHASLDVGGRWAKARKIHRLIPASALHGPGRALLEIGTGSGAIAHYFSALQDAELDVQAVDTVDQRQILEGYRFQEVAGVELPFETARFDVVISNHVLEHVGNAVSQEGHLREIARVLKPDGVGYLASPNRWQLVEPHFHVPFLSWLPRAMRSSYLSLWSRTRRTYDCEPLDMGTIERMFKSSAMDFENLCVPAYHCMIEGEHVRSIFVKLLRRFPDQWLHRLRAVSPTHVYLLRRNGSGQ